MSLIYMPFECFLGISPLGYRYSTYCKSLNTPVQHIITRPLNVLIVLYMKHLHARRYVYVQGWFKTFSNLNSVPASLLQLRLFLQWPIVVGDDSIVHPCPHRNPSSTRVAAQNGFGYLRVGKNWPCVVKAHLYRALKYPYCAIVRKYIPYVLVCMLFSLICNPALTHIC